MLPLLSVVPDTVLYCGSEGIAVTVTPDIRLVAQAPSVVIV